jgi:hypothetical protein
MADRSLEDVMRALKAADAAGNTEDARKLAQIASRMRDSGATGPQSQGFMANVNRGIADGVGGFVDLVNPFDKPTSLMPYSTGSAKDGLAKGMNAIGTNVATGDATGFLDGFARGTGEALGLAAPMAKGAQLMSKAPGLIGQMADDIGQGLASFGALGSEALAGGVSGGAEQAAKDAGLPEWAQQTAAIAAPMGVGALAATKAPGKALDKVKREVAPFTKSGAMAVASNRVVDLAGGGARAAELSGRIVPDNPLNLTPAQQTDDPKMLALEQMAAKEDSALRARLEGRAEQSKDTAEDLLRVDGDIMDTRNFFEQRRREFAERFRAKADDYKSRADESLDRLAPERTEIDNSLATSGKLDNALSAAKAEEAGLWAAIPMDVRVPTAKASAKLADIDATTGAARKGDIPQVAKDLLGENGFGPETSVREMHDLYSKLREIARGAKAGTYVNNNEARIANELADAILLDLGAKGGTTALGRQIDEARAFSAALHDTFDTGAPGRLSTRTIDGDTRIEPELSLSATVGRQGAKGAVAARQISDAAPEANEYIRDYTKQLAREAAIGPTGEFNRKAAAAFAQKNAELLKRYPGLREDLKEAVESREYADQFAARLEQRLGQLQKDKLSAGARLLNGSPQSAIRAFSEARNPVKAARAIVNEARRDGSGQALAGLKSLLSDQLIQGSRMTGDGIIRELSDPKLKAAFRQVFTPAEFSRMQRIAKELQKRDAALKATPDIGSNLAGSNVSTLLDTAARIAGANVGSALGGGDVGASLQAAQIGSSRARDMMRYITRDRASQLIADAVEDPELFRLLLSDVSSPRVEKQFEALLLPYMVGGVSAVTSE